VMIDFAGPWEVFQDVMNPQTKMPAFHLYTVAGTTTPIQASGGMKIVPDFSVHNAPPPKVIVIPAQNGESLALLNWIRQSTKNTDLTMSVCTGAFVLAKTGLLDGRPATTHHSAYKTLAADYLNIRVQRGLRWVEDGNLASAGGLSSGIDRKSTEEHPVCIVCDLDADRDIKTQYRGTTYYFCSQDHKHQFDAAPSKFTS
jgi:transcriptional regulator GlxA family with amidase domain/YHS domain-containing protein